MFKRIIYLVLISLFAFCSNKKTKNEVITSEVITEMDVVPYSCNLDTIPKEVLKSKNTLKGLLIRGDSIKKISDEIQQLRKLEYFDSGGFNLIEVSPKIGNLSHLEELRIYLRSLKVLPKDIEKLSNLRALRIHILNCDSIRFDVDKLKKLEDFLFEIRTDEKCEIIFKEISKIENLEYLVLFLPENSQIDLLEIAHKYLRKCKNLELYYPKFFKDGNKLKKLKTILSYTNVVIPDLM